VVKENIKKLKPGNGISLSWKPQFATFTPNFHATMLTAGSLARLPSSSANSKRSVRSLSGGRSSSPDGSAHSGAAVASTKKSEAHLIEVSYLWSNILPIFLFDDRLCADGLYPPGNKGSAKHFRLEYECSGFEKVEAPKYW
jgi:hypothetical protein